VAVVNAASFQPGFPLSPGVYGSAFGDFASVGVTTSTLPDAVPFPTILSGVEVFVDGVAAPLSFVGSGQINFIVPKNTPTERVPFRIAVSSATVHEGTLDIFPVSPALISSSPGDPTKPGAVLNQDNSRNTQTNPAQRGQIVQIFGLGADFSELPDDGAAAPTDRLIRTSSDPQVFVSVAEADLQFSGLAPNLVNAWQINVTVPNQPFVTGQVPIVAYVQGIGTNLVSIWVAP
jgi:uncharacterized protein (TIGR03437 family)